ncbi:phospholipase domain-containing protein [Streptomyces sp. NPDC048416]|uniref:phospholipase domain-containing protein n=1 Tax=Streptomyces sp. NPDC048416 TaxID=3365546 RepID=UPI003720C494
MRHAPKHSAARRAFVVAAVSTLACTAAALPVKGPAPSVVAVDDCAGGGVDVTARNGGDAPFRFQLAGVAVTVEPGRARTITVPVAERQSYRFTVLGPGGFRQDVDGVLNCATPSPSPSRTAGADPASGAPPVSAAPRDLATLADGRRPVAAGAAAVTDLDSLITGTVLVLLGAMLFVVRRLALP